MGGQYYLVSQLPAFSITQNGPLPVTEEYFLDLCSRFMNKKVLKVLESLTLEPPKEFEKTGFTVLDKWYDFERSLRIALAYLRALKMKKEFTDPTNLLSKVSPEVMQVARTAMAFESPLEAEDYLDQIRIEYLTNNLPYDNFSDDAVIAYGLKLKLANRVKKFNEEAGMASYRKIYDRILGEST